MLQTTSITNLKQNIASIINGVKTTNEPVVILQRSEPAAVIVDPTYYRILEEALEEKEDLRAIADRKNEATVTSEELAKKLEQL